MSDERYQPRLCERSCDSFNDDSGLCLHDDPDAGPYVVPGQICVVWLRQAAEALAAMEAFSDADHATLMTPGVENQYVAWFGKEGKCHYADTPTDAILAAAKAEKGA